MNRARSYCGQIDAQSYAARGDHGHHTLERYVPAAVTGTERLQSSGFAGSQLPTKVHEIEPKLRSASSG